MENTDNTTKALSVEELQQSIHLAWFSVRLIEDRAVFLNSNSSGTKELYDEIHRNVEHLKIVLNQPGLSDLNLDTTGITDAINLGEDLLLKTIWSNE